MVIRRVGLEAWVWLGGLTYLALIDPAACNHFSFCGLRLLGIEHCPGCGLGRSISFLLRGDLAQSFETHWLGIPALLILIHRIYSLFRSAGRRASEPHPISLVNPSGERP